MGYILEPDVLVAETAPAIAERMRHRIGDSCLPVWVVPGAKHNQARTTRPDEYDRRLADFFSSAGRDFNHAATADAIASSATRLPNNQ